MTTFNGGKEPYLFEIIKQQNNISTSYFFLSSIKYGGSIQRSDTWTLKGPCGCASANFNNIRGSNIISITVALAEGESVTVSIGAINENYFTYKGDGDPITVSYSE
jgi:hypothetical protein